MAWLVHLRRQTGSSTGSRSISGLVAVQHAGGHPGPADGDALRQPGHRGPPVAAVVVGAVAPAVAAVAAVVVVVAVMVCVHRRDHERQQQKHRRDDSLHDARTYLLRIGAVDRPLIEE